MTLLASSAWLAVGVILALLAVSAFFSSSEIAIFSLNADWIETAANRGDKGALTLRKLRRDPHRLLVTLLVGNNAVNVAISSITTIVLAGVLPGAQAVTAATVIASVLVLVVGEIVPKSYGLGHAGDWALIVAGPIAVIERLLYPLVSLFDILTRGVSTWIGGERRIERPYVEDEIRRP